VWNAPSSTYTPIGPNHIFLALWMLAQAGFYAPRSLLGWALPVAKTAGNMINFNSAAILFTVCRLLLGKVRQTFLRRIIPVDHHISFHQIVGWCIAFWSIVHGCGHYFIELILSQKVPGMPAPEMQALTTPSGVTGQILCVCLCVMISAAVVSVRRKYYEIFWVTHSLYAVFFLVCLIHVSFCLVKPSDDPTAPPECYIPRKFWKWWIGGAICFLVERVTREIVGRLPTNIVKVVQHPSSTIQVRINRPSIRPKAGQYIYICCPEISSLEWHPFTLASAPHEEYICVYIRLVGDWTKKFAELCGYNDGEGKMEVREPPQILIHGPYGAPAEDVFKFETSVLVAGGIGATPFSSVLKSFWYRLSQPELMKLRKVYFIWVCRDYTAFEWFHDLILELETDAKASNRNFSELLDVSIYLTGKLGIDNVYNICVNEAEEGNRIDTITGLESKTHFGRPDLDKVFGRLSQENRAMDVGVFFCGPARLRDSLLVACNKWTDGTKFGTRFFFAAEVF
ncbi:MAG: hypothetical protein SGCHY_003514, partial [Lobulomycetales sp.]